MEIDTSLVPNACRGCMYNSVNFHEYPCKICRVDDIDGYYGEPSHYRKAPEIRDSGERTQFESGAVRDMHEGKGRMDLLPWNAIIEVSKHCENGAKKYGEHNVDRGIPVHSLMDSGMRHAAKHIAGRDDESHLLAACWNFLWALEMELKHPEQCDIPWENGK